jgi:hypothetical protein
MHGHGSWAPDYGFWVGFFMRRSVIRSLPAIGLFVSVHAAAFAQNAPTLQPTPSDQGFIKRLFDAYAVEFNPPPPAPAG